MTSKDRSKVVLVGAGPVGSLLAIFLARRGFAVDVYERRPDMRKERIAAGRSINLAVSTRGIHALDQIGLGADVLAEAIPMRGRMMHSTAGELTFQPYGKDESEFINSLSRGGLNKALMDAAEKTGRVRIFFQSKAVGIDFGSTLSIQDERTGEVSPIEAPTVIGTDGSASVIRQEMMKLPDFTVSESLLDYGYKEISIPPAPGGGFLMEKNALHIWPRGTYMLIALPNHEGSFTCTLFLPFEGEASFEHLVDGGAVERFFAEQFGDALPLIENLPATFAENPTGHMVTVKCYPWNVRGNEGGGALLLGDSAHAIVPFFGQGMNAGFEDCTVLDACIERRGGGPTVDWSEVFDDFVKLRKVNTDAIADLAVENFIEMRDKVGNKQFLLERAVEKILQREFPGEYYSRYALVTFSRVPYKLALDAGSVIDDILKNLCADLQEPDAFDRAKAAQLIRSRLAPVLKPAMAELTAAR